MQERRSVSHHKTNLLQVVLGNVLDAIVDLVDATLLLPVGIAMVLQLRLKRGEGEVEDQEGEEDER